MARPGRLDSRSLLCQILCVRDDNVVIIVITQIRSCGDLCRTRGRTRSEQESAQMPGEDGRAVSSLVQCPYSRPGRHGGSRRR